MIHSPKYIISFKILRQNTQTFSKTFFQSLHPAFSSYKKETASIGIRNIRKNAFERETSYRFYVPLFRPHSFVSAFRGSYHTKSKVNRGEQKHFSIQSGQKTFYSSHNKIFDATLLLFPCFKKCCLSLLFLP